MRFAVPSPENVWYTVNNLKGKSVTAGWLEVSESGNYSLFVEGLIPMSVKSGMYTIRVKNSGEEYVHAVCYIAKNREN
ncbi:MAG: hypothetical protein HQK83_17780 [Fibrobacteria bacterium]|nr:hypothetical protein [Fibrobacteria bacterium]